MDLVILNTLVKALKYTELTIEGLGYEIGKNALKEYRDSVSGRIKVDFDCFKDVCSDYSVFIGITLNGCMMSNISDDAIAYVNDRMVGNGYLISIAQVMYNGYMVSLEKY